MPEGPEVFRMAENLRRVISGMALLKYQLPSVLRKDEAITSEVVEVFSKGKRIVITLDDGNSILLTFALTGRLVFTDGGDKSATQKDFWENALIAKMIFVDHNRREYVVCLVDKQKLAFALFDDSATIFTQHLPSGFDPLETIEGMREWLAICGKHKNMAVANLLTNQSIVAGIGNRYRSEILHVTKIHPELHIKDLTELHLQKLLVNIYRVLKSAARGEYVFEVVGREKTPVTEIPVHKMEIGKGNFIWTVFKSSIKLHQPAAVAVAAAPMP